MSMKAPALVLALAATVAIGGCARSAGTPGAAPSSGVSLPHAVASTGSPAPTDDASVARADAVTAIAERLIAKVRVPPGSVALAAPPKGTLAGPFSWPSSDDLIDVSALWKTSGTMESVLEYLQAHAPTGLTLTGGGSGGSDAEASLMYTGAAAGPVDQGPELLMTAVPDTSGGVDIRVDVQDIWRPLRTAAETLPTSVTGATIVRTADQVTKTLNADASTARHIAELLNALPTEANAVTHGPQITTGMTVTFVVSGSSLVFTTNEPRSLIGVSANGVEQPLLGDADPVISYLDGLFGIVDPPQPSDTVPPSLPSVHFACPPPGWSPLTATAQELQEYGFPPRPTGAPGADKAWLDAMSHVKLPTCPQASAS